MDYIKIRFTDDLEQLGSQIEKSLDSMFQSLSPRFTLSEPVWKPLMDIYETPEEIIVLADIAGVEKENLELEISSKAVRIHGRREEAWRLDDATYRLAEIQYGKFERTLYLPAPIDTEIVSASYIGGFLKVRLAKVPMGRVHTIPISDG